MSLSKYKKNARYLKDLIYFAEVKGWVRCAGYGGALLYILLRHRYTLDKSKSKVFVTLPLEVREAFGIGTKVIKRLRTQLKRAGLIETKRNAGRPWQYRIIDSVKPVEEEGSLLE